MRVYYYYCCIFQRFQGVDDNGFSTVSRAAQHNDDNNSARGPHGTRTVDSCRRDSDNLNRIIINTGPINSWTARFTPPAEPLVISYTYGPTEMVDIYVYEGQRER